MGIVAFQFCPSCGEYWTPGGREQAADHRKQLCGTCDVKVEYSWLGYGLMGVLMFLLMATSIFPSSGRLAPVPLAVMLALAVYKALRQRRAARSRSSSR